MTGISGVTSISPDMTMQLPSAAPAQSLDSVIETSEAMGAAEFSMQVSTQVLDMAQQPFEDAAAQLLASLAAMTGVGQNIDMMA